MGETEGAKKFGELVVEVEKAVGPLGFKVECANTRWFDRLTGDGEFRITIVREGGSS